MARALIIGGGVAGTVTAIALKKAGLEPVVYEAYDRTADGVGAFLTVAVNGLDALDAIGLKDRLVDKGLDTPRMAMHLGASGKKLGEFPFGSAEDGTVYQTFLRADLYTALREEAEREGVEVRYDRRLVDAERTGGGVRAKFADGSHAEGDLLIGADGLHSRVRTLLDPDAPRARYLGLLNTGGFASGVRIGAEPGVANMIFGRRCFFGYFTHPDGRVWWFANPARAVAPTAAELAAITDEQWRAELIRLFRADRTPAVRIIEATPEIFRPWATYDFPNVPIWHRDRMVIIGDAAHAVSPASGQGASMALEDAVTLARCLRDVDGIDAAFAAYERLRRDRVEAIVVEGKRNGDAKAVGPIGRLVRDFFIARAFRKSGDMPDTSWTWNHHIEWAERVAA
ncbi:FAD-dependent oxidoreductase [Amycolatopsis anabasis]|uniref:FAD-dependent oxidoreductase n=1 Tax=Amycolatopsis anabasis TaxID=1840409 RepID=UPI00131C73F0|nr:NAD(P)/FAD-dependent oxidoreductase [Amycolatopsis anabasis]